MLSVAATNTPGDGTAPAILFHDRDIPAPLFIGTIASLIMSGIAPALLIGALGFPALAPPFTPFPLLLLRITNTNLRTAIGTNAELNARLSY
ncbi:hypothetical protein FHR70_003293 [Microvirga lupini]|uniref:Uncharacterized protein n=1 Tax=Microvirga lupini TaxID=420324 RepID=A0A7W4YX50_9HYPH|nr:hypothetical protein [Microvirga lupini]MBB3020212.1 hypothetical protein [Microvirga lupini]